MNTVGLNSREELAELVRQGVWMIDFSAAWCAPCRDQVGIIDELDTRFHGHVALRIVDIDESRGLALSLGIQSIPTTIIFKQGREVRRFIGLQPIETLEYALQELLT
jgi:thioredoxin 1